MPITKVPLNTPYLSLFVEADKGIVFHHIKRCLYQLPAISISFLLALDEGLNKQRAIADVSDKTHLPKEQLLTFYQEVSSLFNQEGNEHKITYLDGQYPELNNIIGKVFLSPNSKFNTYKVADTTFAIRSQSTRLFKEISLLLSPCARPLTEVDFEIVIVNTRNNDNELFNIYSNDLLVENNVNFNEIIPLIIDRLQILAFQKSEYNFCFHGAALQTPQGNLLLPGKSGAGKSTLSAILANKYNRLFSDEIIALDENFELTILTLPIAIKSGSWEMLTNKYPSLQTAPIWHRIDGRQLKYVWPSAFAHQQKNAKTPFLLVNPNFIDTKNMPSDIELKINKPQKLSVIDTIAMLTQSGYQLGFELNETKLQHLIDFIAKIKCYQISYQSSEQAQEQLALLW